jgi:hypothetical protein
MDEFMLGAVTVASAMVGLFFLRFWRKTRDRFFLCFALSFWIEGLGRVLEALSESLHQDMPAHYLVRLLAYALILFAIVDKNFPRRNKR